ncbi:unnamed protein product, partial [Phaeothamnion confervicola]
KGSKKKSSHLALTPSFPVQFGTSRPLPLERLSLPKRRPPCTMSRSLLALCGTLALTAMRLVEAQPVACLPGGTYYFGGPARSDAVEYLWSYKDYFNGYPRWYLQLQLVNTQLWNTNPYITRVLFERLNGASWVPMYSFLEDYGYGVDPTYDGQTAQGVVTDPSTSITVRLHFVGDGNGCADGYTQAVQMGHYKFISGASDYNRIASGGIPGTTPAWLHPYSTPVSQCTAPGTWSGLRDAPPGAWLQSIKATKMCDCHWRIDVQYNPSYSLMVNNPFIDYISIKVAEGSSQRIRLLVHQPGKSLYSVITPKFNCNLNYIKINGIVYFDEFDGAVGYITRTNSCFAVPAVVSNVCLVSGVAYGGGALPTSCAGLGSESGSYAYSG